MKGVYGAKERTEREMETEKWKLLKGTKWRPCDLLNRLNEDGSRRGKSNKLEEQLIEKFQPVDTKKD